MSSQEQVLENSNQIAAIAEAGKALAIASIKCDLAPYELQEIVLAYAKRELKLMGKIKP